MNIEYTVYRDGPDQNYNFVMHYLFVIFSSCSHHACIESVIYLMLIMIMYVFNFPISIKMFSFSVFSFKRVFGTSMAASEESSALEPETATSSG